jgi:hypothetical protein
MAVRINKDTGYMPYPGAVSNDDRIAELSSVSSNQDPDGILKRHDNFVKDLKGDSNG